MTAALHSFVLCNRIQRKCISTN